MSLCSPLSLSLSFSLFPSPLQWLLHVCRSIGSPGSPADRPNCDEVLEINGRTLNDANHQDIIQYIHQVTKVKLTSYPSPSSSCSLVFATFFSSPLLSPCHSFSFDLHSKNLFHSPLVCSCALCLYPWPLSILTRCTFNLPIVLAHSPVVKGQSIDTQCESNLI